MTNEQLTQEIINLKEHQAKSEAEHEKFELILKELQEDVKTTRNLAEDVHIMAINMKNMQETLNETNKKVDLLNAKEFEEHKENKKIIKNNIISTTIGTIMGTILGIAGWLITTFIQKGG